MFKLLKDQQVDFMSKRKVEMLFSTILLLVAIGSLISRWLNFGSGFTGGTLVEVGYPKSVELADIKKALAAGGFKGATVQYFGSSKDIQIRVAPKEGVTQADIGTKVLAALVKDEPKVERRRSEYVGPQVGDELTEQGRWEGHRSEVQSHHELVCRLLVERDNNLQQLL